MTSPEGPIEYRREFLKRRESTTKQTKVSPKIIIQQSRAKVLFRFHLKAIIAKKRLNIKAKEDFRTPNASRNIIELPDEIISFDRFIILLNDVF